MVRLRGAFVTSQFGRARCSLPITRGPRSLVAANGRPLGVRLSRGDRTNRPGYALSGNALTAGSAIWGFAWFGSYCGPRAGAIEIDAASRAIRAPLRGPQPRCNPSGATSSSLIEGRVDYPGEPVQPPRPEYSRLRLTGRVRPGTDVVQLAPIDLTIRATGADPIVLDPCPAYAGRYYFKSGISAPIDPHFLPCTQRVRIVRPGIPLHITVPATSFGGSATPPGAAVTVDIGIAGVPELHLATTVH